MDPKEIIARLDSADDLDRDAVDAATIAMPAASASERMAMGNALKRHLDRDKQSAAIRAAQKLDAGVHEGSGSGKIEIKAKGYGIALRNRAESLVVDALRANGGSEMDVFRFLEILKATWHAAREDLERNPPPKKRGRPTRAKAGPLPKHVGLLISDYCKDPERKGSARTAVSRLRNSIKERYREGMFENQIVRWLDLQASPERVQILREIVAEICQSDD